MIRNFHITPHNLPFLVQKLERLEPHKQWVVNVTEKRTKRTIEQNSRLWDLYTALGQYIGIDKDEVHELMGYKFLRQQKAINGEQVEVIKSTTKLNTQEITDYMDAIERWGAKIGFVWEWEAA
jgi:hypothetical protein